nr:bestrophin family ion channel [uncultured Sphingobacterium sp.]
MLLNRRISVSYFLKAIQTDLIRIVFFGCLVGLLAKHKDFLTLQIPLSLIAIVGTAISLLLAFRTAQSYDRWWEARIVWGAIVNDSRSLIRLLQTFITRDQDIHLKMFVERQIIWNYALSESLRKESHSKRVGEYLESYQINDTNVAYGILTAHAKHLRLLAQEGLITEFRQVAVDEILTRFSDSMGRCERIKNTVFPVSYGKLIHFLIYLFALLLPFSLNDDVILVKMLLTIGIPIIFIIIERTAILMQDPFENKPMDTPMTTICQTIEMNLLEAIGEPTQKPTTPAEQFYYIL